MNVSSTLASSSHGDVLPLTRRPKAFVTALSEALWYEQKIRGVYVMGLCPGLTSSDLQVNAGGRVEDSPRKPIETPEKVVANGPPCAGERKDSSSTVTSGCQECVLRPQLMTRLMPRKTAVNIMGQGREACPVTMLAARLCP